MITYREVCETPPRDLPNYYTGGAKKLCDICIKKGGVKKAAVIYCKQCDKRLCAKHERVRTAHPGDLYEQSHISEFQSMELTVT